MALLARRSFLQQSLAAGAACSAELLLGRHLPAQTPSSNAAGHGPTVFRYQAHDRLDRPEHLWIFSGTPGARNL